MPQLVVRNLSSEIISRLKRKADSHGVSPEEEHRRILQRALAPEPDAMGYQLLKDILLQMPDAGDDRLFDAHSLS